MIPTKELTEAELKRLAELKARWWEYDQLIPIQAEFAEEKQIEVENEILAIILGER